MLDRISSFIYSYFIYYSCIKLKVKKNPFIVHEVLVSLQACYSYFAGHGALAVEAKSYRKPPRPECIEKELLQPIEPIKCNLYIS